MINAIKWRIEDINSGITTKDKVTLSIFHFLTILTFPIWKINNFDYYRWFFISDASIQNEDGIFFCRKGSWDLCTVREEFEKNLQNYFTIKNGNIFIDVGANVGKYTIKLARKNRKSKVIAFEPKNSNYVALLSNIKINSLDNVIPVNLALYYKKATLKLYSSAEKLGGGGHSIYRKQSDRFDMIKAIALDDYIKRIKGKIELIKLDVEEAEFDVLKGAVKLLKEQHPRLIIETLEEPKFKEIHSFLGKFDYVPFRINNKYSIWEVKKRNRALGRKRILIAGTEKTSNP